MKLSSRKQLLKESELTLKSIKKSLNEMDISGQDSKKVVDWSEEIKKFTESSNRIARRNNDFLTSFETSVGSRLTGRSRWYQRERQDALPSSFIDLLDVLKEQITRLKKLESQIPEIQKIVKSVESDMKKIRGESKKESLKEASVFSSLLNTITKNVVDKFGSDRDILLPIARDMFTKMKNEMKNKNMDDAKLKKALNIIDKVERETITKVGSFQIESFSEMEKYILDSISAETQKQNTMK